MNTIGCFTVTFTGILASVGRSVAEVDRPLFMFL
jgi:hypothetical protein